MRNMSYMWHDFNIKTFPAETIVYRDGVFCPDLSTIPDGPINQNYDLPVHIIYVGEIAGENRLNIRVSIPNQRVFLSVNVKNNLPAFLNILIENTGKNSDVRGHVFLDNYNKLHYVCTAYHLAKNTGIFIQNKLIANKKSVSKMSGTAIIEQRCPDCESDITFSAIAAPDANISFLPAQRIYAVPKSAGHGASIFTPKPIQIQYLRETGLGTLEINDVMREAFMNDFSLF